MSTIVTGRYGAVFVPPGIDTLQAFRRWVHFASLPEKLPIHVLRSDVWLDCERADSLANILLRGELSAVLATLANADNGLYATAGMLWSNDRAGFATLPDGFYMSRASLKAKRVWFSNGGNPKAQATEVVGAPDIVLEIVSDVSEDKDTNWAMSAYFDAGIQEYWVFDARDLDDMQFTIFKRGRKEFIAARASGGWTKSAVLGKSFRLTQTEGDDGNPEFTFEYR